MDTQPRHLPKSLAAVRRSGCVLGSALAFTVLSLVPASAAVQPDAGTAGGGATSQPTRPAAAAWYRPTSPTCALPVGCLPVSPPSPYPADTLHVGVLAGQEESRTYVALPLPSSGVLRGGSLQLPVASAADGSLQPETAKLRACLVTGTVKDKVSGDVTTPPAPDCSVSSPAVASTSGTTLVLTVDLAPFVLHWSGSPMGAVALLPADAPAPSDVWHVAFSRHDRTGEGVVPLSASLLVESGEAPAPTPDIQGDPFTPAPQLPVATLDPPVAPGLFPEVVVEQPAPQTPNVAGGPALVPAAAQSVDTSFAYPGVFLLPILVLLAGAWVARAFTRDLADEQK